MTRLVRAERDAYQGRKNRGLIVQFVIFVILRGIDMGSSITLLKNAWSQSYAWSNLDLALFNTSENLSAKGDGLDNVDELCQESSKWEKEEVDDTVKKYNIILVLAAFFNSVSVLLFLIHFGSWIATLQMTLRDTITTDSDYLVSRLTRSSLLSLMTAVVRDVPLSCLNSELLVLRTGHNGLLCIGCTFSQSCSSKSFVQESLSTARRLLQFSYSTILVNSFWKGVSGFYRLSRIREYDLHFIRACASLVFGFLYCSATFTPALLILMYRYFAIPGLESHFFYDAASKIVVIGGVIWVVGGIAVLCCPLLDAIKLTAD